MRVALVTLAQLSRFSMDINSQIQGKNFLVCTPISLVIRKHVPDNWCLKSGISMTYTCSATWTSYNHEGFGVASVCIVYNILKELRNATDGNIIFACLNYCLMKSL